MTTIDEEIVAVRMVRRFLYDLLSPETTPGVPSEIRMKARRVCKHFPLMDDSPAAVLTPRARLLEEVKAITIERGHYYGPPHEHFARTIGMINALYGTSFAPEDWAKFMMCDKLARDAERPKRDNCADIAGYAACLHEVRESGSRADGSGGTP